MIKNEFLSIIPSLSSVRECLMKEVIIFTNSKVLSDLLSITMLTSDINLHNMINKNMKKMEEEEQMPFLFNGLRYNTYREDVFFIVKDKNKFIGGIVLGYKEKGWNVKGDQKYVVKSVSVNEKHQGKGLSRLLINNLFDFCASHSIKVIKQSAYTREGKTKIRHIFKDVALSYPEVKFVDNNYMM